MATPEMPPEILDRLTRVEDAVQRFEFVHMVKVDATTAGLGVLYAQQKRMQEELSGFRAEVAAEFEALKSDVSAGLSAVTAEQVRQGGLLEEILRRLPGQ